MAIPTGSGTETLHTHIFKDVDATQTLILGAQHHTYSVISLTVLCNVLDATADTFTISLIGWDSHAGASAQTMEICRGNPQVGETFIWNDRFSFFGYEPTGISGAFGNAAYQIALAAQGGSVAQQLSFGMSDADDDYDVCVTYIDQDWS